MMFRALALFIFQVLIFSAGKIPIFGKGGGGGGHLHRFWLLTYIHLDEHKKDYDPNPN